MIPKQRRNNGYSLVNPYTRTEPQTAIHVYNLVFQTNAFKCKKCLPALENWQKTGLDTTLAAPRKFSSACTLILMMSAEVEPERHSQLNSQQQASAIAPALAACSPREHDISTRQPSLHIRKLNLIGSE